ncbi:MAG: hypothetical protein PHX33_08535, partial [Candidatus Cloacimonetes bacterium]|nr:hypothetical protein [Candidatus Cloacimonadota bacterium]
FVYYIVHIGYGTIWRGVVYQPRSILGGGMSLDYGILKQKGICKNRSRYLSAPVFIFMGLA